MAAWDDLKSSGNGSIGARLAIAGVPFQAVSSRSMETSTRMGGLLMDGLNLSEEVNFATAQITLGSFTATIVDAPAYVATALSATPWTDLFAGRPSRRCWLTVTAAAGDATLTVTSTDGWDASGTLYIDQEAITYTGVTATTFTGCTRGMYGSLATSHYALDTTATRAAEVTDRPLTMEGRHCVLYTYAGQDTPTGNGTQVWLGIISTDARLGDDGCTWTLTIDPITRIFQGPLGGDLIGDFPARGIYYNEQCCFRIDCYVSTDNTVGNSPHTPTWSDKVYGFYETQDAFVTAVNAKIDSHATTAATGLGLRCVSDGPSGFHFELATGAGVNNRFVGLYAASPIDKAHVGGYVGLYPLCSIGDNTEDPSTITTGTTASTFYRYAQVTGPKIPTGTPAWGAGTFTDAVDAPGAVPRGSWASSYTQIPDPPGGRGRGLYRTSGPTAPATRLYLGGTLDISGVTNVAIDLGGDTKISALVTATAGTRYFDATHDATPEAQAFCYAGSVHPKFTPMRSYVNGGTLADLRTALINATQVGAPIGTAPYIFDASLSSGSAITSDFGTWSAVSAVASRGTAQRIFVAVKSLKLGDVLMEEAKNIGCFFALDTNGRIGVFQVGIAPTGVSWTINSTNELTDQGPSGWERNGLGSIAKLVVKTGYDPVDDSYKGPTYTFTDVTAYGRNPSAQTVEIKPKSQQTFTIGPLSPGIADDYAQVAAGIFSLYGYPYDLITINVPMTLFDARCGDTVVITSKNLPEGTTGLRGMVTRSGVIFGRSWNLATGEGQLKILASEINYAGYTPTGRTSTKVDNGGNNWTITIATPAAGVTAGYSPATSFVAGDKIRVVLWDSTTDSTVTGTVQSNNGVDKVTVQLDGVWVPGGSTWDLQYSTTDAPWQTSQRIYCAVADGVDRITYTLTTHARQFAP